MQLLAGSKPIQPADGEEQFAPRVGLGEAAVLLGVGVNQAADVAGRDLQGAGKADHQVREILADAGAVLEDVGDGAGGVGDALAGR